MMSVSVKRRHDQAWWYAAGRLDEQGGADSGDFERFACFAAKEAKAYDEGTVSFLPSIMDQWERFRADPES